MLGVHLLGVVPSYVAQLAPTVRVLLLSDREDDIHLISTAATAARIKSVRVCPDVLRYLRREEPYADVLPPDLVLLDLDLSDRSHCDTLRDIKDDPRFRRIPVVVLADDASDEAVAEAYDLRANAVVVKPRERGAFRRMIETTLSFWLGLAELQ